MFKNYGDICKMEGSKVEPVDCVVGGSPCFPKDTKIITLFGAKAIQDISIGDLVLTHKGRYRPVLCVGSHKDSLVRLSSCVHSIYCTRNHPFYSIDDNYNTGWTPAENMVGLSWAYLEEAPGYPVSFEKVLICEETGIICDVFNLEVDEDNSYVANRLLVHNCQNLSVAGNRKGLEGKESRLFFEQMRLIRDMRVSSGYSKPRFMILENVVGLLNCNKGRDFLIVLNECVQAAMLGKIKELDNGEEKQDETGMYKNTIPDVPMPKNGKWPRSGLLYDDLGRWSIAWRVHDAQYWGVAQRRRRISLVIDFGGMSAPEVLFEQQSDTRNFNQSYTQREGTSTSSEGCFGESDREPNQIGKDSHIKENVPICIGNGQAHVTNQYTTDLSQTLNCMHDPMTILEPKDFHYYVRRLTPLEYTRLQGFPDHWVDIGDWVDSTGKKHKSSDAPKYKALGNSIALPFWRWLSKNIVNKIREDNRGYPPTMGSLFSGIGGFDLCWKECGGETLWFSEIDEFCIAVLKSHF